MKRLLLAPLLVCACAAPAKPGPQPTTPPPASCGGEVDAIAARVEKAWGTPASPRFSFAGHVPDVSKSVQSYDKQRRDFVDDLRPHTTGAMACAAAAHVQIGVVDDIFRAAVLRAKLDTIPPESEAKLAEIESNANKVLSDPSATPQAKEGAKSSLASVAQVRANTAEMGKTALKGWSAYAEMELIDAYARGMIEARKSGLKGSIYSSAWARMGVIVNESGTELVNERLERVKKDHADVPLDASAFQSPCSWPAGC